MSQDAPYLGLLNSGQRQAVLHTGNPLLILAGAGSGKTRVITTKIAWLIRERGIAPYSILAVTFTNKAAREMAERARQIDERAADAMLRTFHSFGAWFLRRNGELAGLGSGFVIYDDGDMVSLLSTIMKGAQKAEVKQAAHKISRAKDYFLSPADSALAAIDGTDEFRDLYAEYEKRLADIGNVDFGDLIKKPVEILRSEPDVARRLRDRFSVIMVDEYQDANIAQFELLKELTGPNTYICVVGDDDQSIYRFRGAEVKNILEFPDKFPNAEIIKLESNYRSTSPILRAASSVVDYNKGRLGKTLYAERGEGKQPVLAFLPDQYEEVNFCAALIESSVKNDSTLQWSDWAVLYRTNAQSRVFETEFRRRGIPYRVVGSLEFYKREEIKDALSLLSIMVNPRDEVAFRRMINKPARGLGPVTVNLLIDEAMGREGDFLKTLTEIEHKLKPKAQKGLKAFRELMENSWSMLGTGLMESDTKSGPTKRKMPPTRKEGELVAGEGLSVCVAQTIKASGLVEYHLMQDEIAGNQRLNNLQELVNAASMFAGTKEGLLEFLECLELDRSIVEGTPQSDGSPDDENKVTLITFHNTKGLEFRRVIMTGLEHGIFPREDKRNEELEEERRLFYVGATRAMDELYLTSCAMRPMFGRTVPVEPSVFLHEIDKGCMRIIGDAPRSFGGRSFGNAGHKRVGETETEIGGWRRGQRLFHDDHGYGSVLEVRDSDDGPIVKVQFEMGKTVQFLSEHQGSAFEKIGDDV
ncbi:MAG: ATP-dependent helicase [Treponema sp.]|nr:ATP-dependent helicase [Treponema sp.]